MMYLECQQELDGDQVAVRNSLPFATERLLREADRNDGQSAGVSEQQLQQLVRELRDRKNGSLPPELGVDPTEIAQEMAFQAMESDETDAALVLADRAISLDPHCVDALAIRATLSAESDGELIEQLQKAVAVGDARLGEEFFAENMGDFWTLVEARPYLRTVRRLAEALWDAGRRFDAISQSCAALAHYLAGDTIAADTALTRAKRLNPHLLPYLTGDLEIPDELCTRFAPGSEDEAIACGQILGDAWSSQSAAYLWLLACDDEIGAEDAVGTPE